MYWKACITRTGCLSCKQRLISVVNKKRSIKIFFVGLADRFSDYFEIFPKKSRKSKQKKRNGTTSIASKNLMKIWRCFLRLIAGWDSQFCTACTVSVIIILTFVGIVHYDFRLLFQKQRVIQFYIYRTPFSQFKRQLTRPTRNIPLIFTSSES